MATMERALRVGLALLAVGVAGISCNDNTVPVGTAGTVTVRAFVDNDGSGDYSTGDVALTGTVSLSPIGGGTPIPGTLGADGKVVLTGVAPGSYTATLTATPPTGAVLSGATVPVVVIPFTGGAVETDFRYAETPGTISGVFFKDNNANGVYDAGVDTPAPGMTVQLFAGTDTTKATYSVTITGSAGDFRFPGLRPGTYTVRVIPIPTIQVVGNASTTVVVGSAAVTATSAKFTGNLLTTVAAARAATVGSTVAFTAVAAVNAGQISSNTLYVQDATGGMQVFGAPTAGIVAGDTVRIIGITALFSGELEVEAPSGGTLSVTRVGTGVAPAPRTITVAQLISNQFAGQLVTVTGVTVRSVVNTSTTAYNVNVQGSSPADTFQVRILSRTLVPIDTLAWVKGAAYDVTGLDGYFNGLPQLKPRSSADMKPGTAILTVATARGHPANDTVTVVGVVYTGTGIYTLPTSTSLTAYLQDATGGAELFGVPSTLNTGDSISVQGIVSIFSGEFEISRFSTSSPLVIQAFGKGTTHAARTTTGAELASKAFDGQLLKLTGLKVLTVGTVSASTGSYSVTTTAPDGTALTVFINASPVGIPASFWQVGTSYDVTGAALNFVSGSTTTPEIKPRSTADASVTGGG